MCNNKPFLAIYDISGIQEYIFATNELKQNIGASKIVGNLMKTELVDVLKSFDQPATIKWDWETNEPFQLFDKTAVRAEVVFIGGGNALVAYRDRQLFQQVNKRLSIRLIEKSYTLTLLIEEKELAKDKSYYATYKELQNKLAQAKEERLRPKPFGAYPISAQESFSGFPITQKAGQSTIQALKARAAGTPNLNELVKPPEKRTWALHINDLKKKLDEDSYIAVIHIDGNGIGQKLDQTLKAHEGKSFSEEIKNHRSLSRDISAGYRKLVEEVVQEINWEKNDRPIPIRPLIMDGDDLTLICRAEWGLPLTEALLTKMKTHTSETKFSLSACAGIAYVHGHFPFHLAYEIAEACCKEAKSKRLKNEKNDSQESYIDFQLVRGSDPTERDVTGRDEESLGRKRPYALSSEKDSLKKLIDIIKELQGYRAEPNSLFPRSKQAQLYQAYLKGAGHVEITEEEFKSKKVPLKSINRELLLDAFELVDYYEEAIFRVKEGNV